MSESTKQQRQAKKTEGNLDPAKEGTERAAAEAGTEVEGRSVLLFITCPHCGSTGLDCLFKCRKLLIDLKPFPGTFAVGVDPNNDAARLWLASVKPFFAPLALALAL